jgi:hypothetical protein
MQFFLSGLNAPLFSSPHKIKKCERLREKNPHVTARTETTSNKKNPKRACHADPGG